MADEDLDRSFNLDGSRFAHLLKPIRDLADNWGIDIANDLEDYLQHLNKTSFTFDGGPRLDFAEAALLIQSSACVYSRKVDFLHTLVYQALDAVRAKKRGDGSETGVQEAGATQRERVQRNAAAQDTDDTVEGFMSAGLQLEEADDINLGVDEDATAAVYVRTPAALLALEDQGTGEGDGDAGFYRLAQCYVHVSGALLLDANDADLYDLGLNSTGLCGAAHTHSTLEAGTQVKAVALPAGVAIAQQQGQQQRMDGDDDDDENDNGDGGGMSDDDDDDDGGGGAAHTSKQGADQPGVSLAAPGQSLAPGMTTGAGGTVSLAAGLHTLDATSREQQQAGGEGEDELQGAGTHAGQRAAGSQVARAGASTQDDFSVWQPLDMNEPGSLPVKPMQVKRPSKARFRPVVVASSLTGAAHTKASQRAAGPYLNYPEFEYGLQLTQSLTQPAARRPTRLTRGAATRGYLDTAAALPVFDAADVAAAGAGLQDAITQQQQEVAAGEAGVQEEAGGWDGDDDDGFGGDAGGGGGSDEYGDGPGDQAYTSGLDAMDLMQGLGQQPLGGGVFGGGGDAFEAGDGEADTSYEELCRSHIEAMMAAAAAQEVQTELAQRVTGWRSKIDPVLHDEEGRKGFDIQQYQHKIINKLEKQKIKKAAAVEEIEFCVVAKQKEKWEVSRTFAAMLQLINNRNVALVKSGAPDAPFSLQLLNPELLHKSMGTRLGKAGQAEGQQAGGDQDMAEGQAEEEGEEEEQGGDDGDGAAGDQGAAGDLVENQGDAGNMPAGKKSSKSGKGSKKATHKDVSKPRPSKKVKA